MSATTAVLAGRRAAERLMVDACTIRRVTGTSTDNVTGVVTPTYTVIYSGKCRVQQQVPVSKPGNVGQAAVWLQRSELQVPMSAPPALSDDRVDITTSALDPNLPGTVYHVRDLGAKTHSTKRVYQIEQATS
jgi:hypothetical protein